MIKDSTLAFLLILLSSICLSLASFFCFSISFNSCLFNSTENSNLIESVLTKVLKYAIGFLLASFSVFSKQNFKNSKFSTLRYSSNNNLETS
ncbi:MAG: hypothetical protein JXM74_02630 [Fusobacteriaceae bacterium]|nr:hypothetical protein [Fusobacteriaceae bacterium]